MICSMASGICSALVALAMSMSTLTKRIGCGESAAWAANGDRINAPFRPDTDCSNYSPRR